MQCFFMDQNVGPILLFLDHVYIEKKKVLGYVISSVRFHFSVLRRAVVCHPSDPEVGLGVIKGENDCLALI